MVHRKEMALIHGLDVEKENANASNGIQNSVFGPFFGCENFFEI